MAMEENSMLRLPYNIRDVRLGPVQISRSIRPERVSCVSTYEHVYISSICFRIFSKSYICIYEHSPISVGAAISSGVAAFYRVRIRLDLFSASYVKPLNASFGSEHSSSEIDYVLKLEDDRPGNRAFLLDPLLSNATRIIITFYPITPSDVLQLFGRATGDKKKCHRVYSTSSALENASCSRRRFAALNARYAVEGQLPLTERVTESVDCESARPPLRRQCRRRGSRSH